MIAAPGVGEEVGGYRLDEQLGEGGMGVVYRATHRVLGKKAAVKLMRPRLCADEESVRRFFNEAVLTASIRHPGIVEVYDYGVHDSGSAYIAMALLDGESLESRLKNDGAMPLLEALRISRQIAGALSAAHAEGVVHRDLKPDNVFLTSDPDVPGGERTQLLDFGIAKLLADEDGSAALTRTGTVLGTPLYMSPEQCRGKSDLDGRTDLYALGCMLYQMLAGRPPFSGESALEVGAAHVRDQPQPLAELCSGLAPEIASLVHEMLAKKREDRPADGAVVAERLTRLISTIETSPLSGRHRVATVPFQVRDSSESIELAETVGATGEDGETIEPIADDAEGADPETTPRRRTLLALAATMALVVVGGVLIYSLFPASDAELVNAATARDGCPAEAATCRAFADVVWRGDGFPADLDYARSLLADACKRGEQLACIDEVIFERRAAIPASRMPNLGVRSAPIDVTVALDYTKDGVDEWIERMAQLDRRHYGNARIHIAALISSDSARALAEVACILTTDRSFGMFTALRRSFVEGDMRSVPRAADLLQLSGGDPKMADKVGGDCERDVTAQASALGRHRVTENGTLFVGGKRLDPPYSDEAIDALVLEAIEFNRNRDGRISFTRDRVSSSRHRREIPPTPRPDQAVQVVSFCDPAAATCQSVLSHNEHFPDVFGAVVQTDVRPFIRLDDQERTRSACALIRLRLLDSLHMAQLSVPRVDGRRQWLTADDMQGIARAANIPDSEFTHYRDIVCPGDIRAAQNQLMQAHGSLVSMSFVNGRPAPLGHLTAIRAMITEELQLAEKVGLGDNLSVDQFRALLHRYDSQ